MAYSGRAGALTVVWPASAGPARYAYVSQPASAVRGTVTDWRALDACPVQCSSTASAYSSPGALYCCTAVRHGTVAVRTGSCTSVWPYLVDLVVHSGGQLRGLILLVQGSNSISCMNNKNGLSAVSSGSYLDQRLL